MFLRTKVALLNKLSSKNKQKGLTIVEYAIAGALVAAALIGTFAALGGTISNLIEFLNESLTVE